MRRPIAITECRLSDLAPPLYDSVATLWEDDIGGTFADFNHRSTFVLTLHAAPNPRIIPRAVDWERAAVLLYIKVRPRVINFGRVTMPAWRQQGYAGMLLCHLRALYPRHTLTCENVNPVLTKSLRRAGFTSASPDSLCMVWKPGKT
jgi:GNAT superfamily N-acetyltransferase